MKKRVVSILFATIVKQNKDKAWKSLRHEDGELCFGGGWFIVGIDTPEGSYTYHYEDNYYSLFDCEELERGKHWDGHTEKDVTRLLSLPKAQLSQEGTTKDAISRQAALEKVRAMQTYKLFMGDDMILVDKAEVQTELMMLPPIQHEPRTGKWALGFDNRYMEKYYYCSRCGGRKYGEHEPLDYFCSNCGADMRGEKDG